MCRLMPTTHDEFLEVKGVSTVWLEKYGDAFMNVIKENTLSYEDKDNKYDVTEIRNNGLSGAKEPWTEKEIAKLEFEY